MITLSRQVKTFVAAERVSDWPCRIWQLHCPFETFRPLGCAIDEARVGQYEIAKLVAFAHDDKRWPSAQAVPVAPFLRAYRVMVETGMFPGDSPFSFPTMRAGQSLSLEFDQSLDYAEVIFWGVMVDSVLPVKDDAWKKEQPIHAVLFCPVCKKQHLDVEEFATRVHRTHKCDYTTEGPNTGCGHEWKPFSYATRGVVAAALLVGLEGRQNELRQLIFDGKAK